MISMEALRRRFDKQGFLLLGLCLVLLCNLRAFSLRSSVPWDARDMWWYYFRWFGTGLREGFWTDWIPNVAAGFPIGSSLEVGSHNILYLFFAWLFPDTVLSINLLYLFFQLCLFAFAFYFVVELGLSRLCAFFVGLCVVASGYFTGHASHFSYLSTAVNVLLLVWGIYRAYMGKKKSAFIMMAWAIYQLGTSCYPAVASFCAQSIFLWLLVLAARNFRQFKTMFPVLFLASLLGLLLAVPALMAFYNQVSKTARIHGLSVEEVLFGSMPIQNWLNIFVPILRLDTKTPWSVDPTMDRFHLLFLTPWFALLAFYFGFVKKTLSKKMLGILFFVFLLTTLLALGRHSPLPLRAWLAEALPFYRFGRFPGAEHSIVALWFLALLSAAGLGKFEQWLSHKKQSLRVVLIVLIALDFVVVMAGTIHVRYMRLPPDLHGVLLRPKMTYTTEEQALLDSPRGCPLLPLLEFDQRETMPHRFTWDAYINPISVKYTSQKEEYRWALCGPSRLWDAQNKKPVTWTLLSYTPSKIHFRVFLDQPTTLLWAEFNDGFWQLKNNGEPSEFLKDSPADLRFFALPAGLHEVEMVYLSPLGRLFRRQ